MSKLILQFEGRMLKDFAAGASGLTIGRLPDNAIIIDNPAVSGHHARVVREGEQMVVEDLRSTNGTYVNTHQVTRHVLRHGDVVLIGKHHLVFDQAAGIDQPAPAVLQGLGDTVYLDTKQHRALRATLEDARSEAERIAKSRAAAKSTARAGVLHVIAGEADEDEYDLSAQTSLIGRSSSAHVRLRGWFKPSVAVAIARSSEGYVVTPMGGKPSLNHEPLTSRHYLDEGDVLTVSGLVLEFHWKDPQPTESAA